MNPTIDNKELTTGKLISFYRKLKNINQDTIAFALNVSQSKVSDWETDKISPSVEDILQLSTILEVQPAQLLPYSSVSFNNQFNDSAVNNGHINNGPFVSHYNNLDELKLAFQELLKAKDEVIDILKAQLSK